jgi:hypothetical protein
MPWDLTPEEADKFNRLSRGEKVDLSPAEAQKLQPIFAERSKLKPKQEQLGLGDMALEALKELPGSLKAMVVPTRGEKPGMADWQSAGMAALSATDIGFRPPPLMKSDSPQQMEQQRREVGKMVDDEFNDARARHPKTALAAGVLSPFPTKVKEQMLVSGLVGMLHGAHSAPAPKERMLGFLPGQEEVAGALVGGGVNALVAGALGKGIEKGSATTKALLGPATKRLLARLGMKELAPEPKTVPEGPLDAQAREQAAANARGGEPPTSVDYANVENPEPSARVDGTRVSPYHNEPPLMQLLREQPTMPGRGGPPPEVPTRASNPRPGLSRDRIVTNPGDQQLRAEVLGQEPRTFPDVEEPVTRTSRPRPGLPPDRLETNPSVRQQLAELLGAEPRTDPLLDPEVTASSRRPLAGEPTVVDRPFLSRSLRKAQLVPEGRAPSYAEPVTHVGPEAPAEKLARLLRELGVGSRAGEPSVNEKLGKVRELNAERPTVVDDPREADYLRQSGFYEAAAAADRGDPSAMMKWLNENPQGAKTAKEIGLVLAGEHRKFNASRELTKPLRTEVPRDVQGTAAASPKAAERSLGGAPPEPSVDANIAWLSGEDELEKTATKYVPRDSLLPRSQQNPEMTWVASHRLKPEIQGGSGEPPRPAATQQSGPPVSAPLQPTDLDEMFHALAAQSQKLLAADTGLRARFLKQFSLPEFRGDELLGQAVRSVNASRAIGDFQMQRLYPALQRVIEKLPSVDRATVQKVITQLRDRKATVADLNKLPAEFRALFDQMHREQQAQLVELAKGGYFGPQELATISQNLKKGLLHLHRSYQAFYARRSWKPPEDAIVRAAKFIAESMGMDPVQANARVRAVLKTAAEGEGFQNVQQMLGAFRDAGLVKARTLPPPLHALLGVVNDPAFVVAETASQMSSMYHLMMRTRALLAPDLEGKVWAQQWVPGMDERPLWNEQMSPAQNKRLFGELAGKFVHPALRQSMLDAPAPLVENFARDFAHKVTGWFATAKVLTSPVTWARNIISNGLYLTASGVPVWRQPVLMAKAFRSILAGQKRLSASLAQGHEWLQMALEDGAVRPGRGTDLGGSEARAIAENVLRSKPDGLMGFWDSAMRMMQKGQLKLGKTYELFDSAARLAAYMHHVEAGRQRLGLSPQQARSHASHIVNRYFATGAGAAPIFRELSRSSLGLAPFIGWHVDNLRVAKNILADSMKGDLGPLMRTAAWMAAPMVAAYMARQLYGITDSDVAAGERALKGSWRDRQGLHDWLPVRGKDGRLVYAVSFDGLNPFALFLRGAPQMSIPQRVAASIVQGMVQSGSMEPWVNDQLASLGVTPQEYEPPLLPGQEGWKAASGVAQFMEPALMRQFRTVARKAQLDLGQPLRPTEEPQGLGEALLTTFSPIGIEKVGERTQRGAQKQLRGERAGLLDARKRVRGINDPDERSRVLEAIPERMKQLRDRFK